MDIVLLIFAVRWRWIMTTMIKTEKKFDCVEFKRQSQNSLMKEYNSRKTEFDSFIEFIKTKTSEDKWAQDVWLSISGR